MRETLEKLLSLLEHKQTVLQELIERQQAFKTFLIRPDWKKYYDVTKPQEELLNRLRQIQSAQDYLLSDLGRRLRLRGKVTLKGLCPCLEPKWRQSLLSAIDKIREAVEALRGLTQLSQILHAGHARFLRECQETIGGGQGNNFYTPHGYTRAFQENRFVREV